MNVVIHDLPKGQINNIFDSTKKDIQIISDNGNIKNCIGCFDVSFMIVTIIWVQFFQKQNM